MQRFVSGVEDWLRIERGCREFLEIVAKSDRVIVIDLNISSRVVTFKLRADIVRRLDALIKKHGLGTRSSLLRKLSEALVAALEELEDRTSIDSISIRVNYTDRSGLKKSVDVVVNAA